MQEKQVQQTKYAQGPKISQISYPSKGDTVEYKKMLLYLYTPMLIKSA